MNKLRLGIKLSLGFGTILLLTLFLGVTGYRELASISAESSLIADRIVPQLELSTHLQKNLNKAEALFTRYINSPTETEEQATKTGVNELARTFDDLQSLSRAHPEFVRLASFVTDADFQLKEYISSIRNTINIQKDLLRYQSAMNVAAASLERGVEGLLGLFRADISGKAQQGGIELQELLVGQYSVDALKTQIQTMRSEVQQATLDRSPNDVTQQIRRIPDLQLRFERLGEKLQRSEHKQALNEAGQELQDFLDNLNKVHDGFIAQAETLARQTTLCTSLREQTEGLADQNTTSIKNTTSAVALDTQETTTQMFAILVVAVLCTIVIAVLATRGVTVPIRQGAAFAAEVARGSFDARWETPLQDEIGELATSLNTAFSKVTAKVHWYESVLNAIPFALSVTDMDMKWTFMNSFGLSAINRKHFSEIEGLHCSEKKGDICNTPNCGIESLRHGKPTVTFKTTKGRTMLVQLSFLKDSSGNTIGHVEIGNDITEEENLRAEATHALERGRQETAAGLGGVVETLGSASIDLSAQIEQCNRGAENASAQLSETASAMGEMNATVLEVARNSSAASEISSKARVLAQEGSEDVNVLMANMDKLYKSSLNIKTDMQELGHQADAINQIMRVISDIADQTNLLALNAAIEAARAGDAGRGFAVVADEVRKLAEKTMASTGNVAQAIGAIQEGTRKNIANVDLTAVQIEEMTVLTKKSDASLIQIVQLVETTSDQIRAIATASEEQAATSDEITRSLDRINSIALESVTAMNEANDSVKKLVSQADILKEHIQKLTS